ncbi:MAG: hypothetical protein ACKVU4_12045 [Phycisphaerales bacterium]
MPKDPDTLVDLTTARTAFEAEMIAESLRAQGIPAEAFTTAGTMLQWDIAGTQPMRVQVRRRDLDAATAALRAIRAESVDLDWDEVDTGSFRHEFVDLRGRCISCQYDLTSLPDAPRCPECGTSLVRAVGEGSNRPAQAVRQTTQQRPRWLCRWLLLACAVSLPAGAGFMLLDLTLWHPWGNVYNDLILKGGALGGICVVFFAILAMNRRQPSP